MLSPSSADGTCPVRFLPSVMAALFAMRPPRHHCALTTQLHPATLAPVARAHCACMLLRAMTFIVHSIA